MEGLNENIHEKIQDIFGKMPAKFSVLEEEIDIELQMEYFEFGKLHKSDLTKDQIIKRKERLFDKNTTVSEKKQLLSLLASLEEVIAYRTIEKYLENPDKDIKDWAILALQESRMSLESSLLEENQVFISTGLGGKGKKLRYFIVIIYARNKKVEKVQKKVIENEFEFLFNKLDAEIEEINHYHLYSTIKSVIPISVPINSLIQRSIKECNEYGNFINEKFIITNVKILSAKEIKRYLEKNKLI